MDVLGTPERADVHAVRGASLGSQLPSYLVAPVSLRSMPKPQAGYQFKIIDFGSSHTTDEMPQIHCPLVFRPPEALFDHEWGTEADVWSLGCTVRSVWKFNQLCQSNANQCCRCLNSSLGIHLSIISYQIEMFSSGIGSQRSGLCRISGLVILLSPEWALRTSINQIWRTGYTILTLTTISPWGLQRHISRWLEKCCNQSCSISPRIVHDFQGYWNTPGSRRILL